MTFRSVLVAVLVVLAFTALTTQEASGQPIPGDCNCNGSLDAGDPVCTVLRIIGAFSPDTCAATVDPDAIYVSSTDTGGDDASGCGRGPVGSGAGNHPCLSIGTGIDEAVASARSRVLVAAGAYDESVVLVDGISVLGGFNPFTWQRDAALNATAIFGGQVGAHMKAVVAVGITAPTVFDGFLVVGGNGSSVSQNSYGIYVHNCDSGLEVTGNTIWAGNGGNGTNGDVGLAGDDGASGQQGLAAREPAEGFRCFEECTGQTTNEGGLGGENFCNAVNVSGGDGGEADCPDYDEVSGNLCGDCTDYNDLQQTVKSWNDGQNAPGGGAGGIGGCDSLIDYACNGNSCNCVQPPAASCPQGRDASPGLAGVSGDAGAGGSACIEGSGTAHNGEWASDAGDPGEAGSPGTGGGGGGAGGGVEVYDSTACGDGGSDLGGSGGGGGAGGCGGDGGDGGKAGGASIGIFVLFDMLPAGDVPLISGNVIRTASGGAGGHGGTAGTGGSGGLGGAGGAAGQTVSTFCASAGANGGAGGIGGHGGGGGGGCGGAAFGIFAFGQGGTDLSAYEKPNNVFELGGTGGPGGHGGGAPSGGSPGYDAVAGVAAETNF